MKNFKEYQTPEWVDTILILLILPVALFLVVSGTQLLAGNYYGWLAPAPKDFLNQRTPIVLKGINEQTDFCECGEDESCKACREIIKFKSNPKIQEANQILIKREDIVWLITEESQKAGVDYLESLNIAYCESKLDPKAENKKSSAKGLFQFTFKTWTTYCHGNVFDAKDNTDCFLKLYVFKPDWWKCKGNVL